MGVGTHPGIRPDVDLADDLDGVHLMDVLLTDCTYLVTGGGSGIGKGAAEAVVGLLGPIFEMPDIAGDYAANTPLPRFGEVEDVANLAVLLLSDAAGWITGQLINVDGGFMLRRGPDYSTLVGQMYGPNALRGVVSETVN